ncbi:MAG: RDD family protein [Actinobacteria bacterium]|nr:RDD family protein [Actinomycetota bacterium]
MAAIIDGVLVGVVNGVLFGLMRGAGYGLGGLVGLAYAIYFEGSPSGQTVGKKVMNIRIVDADNGGPIGYGRAFVRWIGKIISAIPCALGYFWMLWDPNKQTWHDKMASSVVVPTSAYPVAAWPG